MPAPFRSPPRRKRPAPPHTQGSVPGGDGERLQKVLAAAGIGSRRKCEELITAGRITVDGQTVTQLGTKVDPEASEIRVDGEPLARQQRRMYFMLNKPEGVVTTSRDPSGRPRVVDLVPDGQRLFAVGRLDLSSEGLILMTNDGPLANLLAHPRYGVEKTYQALVVGVPEPAVLERLRQGVRLAEGRAHAKRVSIKSQHKQSALLELVLDEGKNREVRRLLAQVGHKVLRLKRTALGPLRLGDLAPGEFRPLKKEEVQALREAAEKQGAEVRRQGPGARDRSPAGPGNAPRPGMPRTVGTVIGGQAPRGPRPGGSRPSKGAPAGRRQRFQSRRDKAGGS